MDVAKTSPKTEAERRVDIGMLSLLEGRFFFNPRTI